MAAHHLAWGVKKWGAARAFSIDGMGRSSWHTSSMGLHPFVEGDCFCALALHPPWLSGSPMPGGHKGQ
jgi:hypothetical protein